MTCNTGVYICPENDNKFKQPPEEKKRAKKKKDE
jgi:hypothetical protein